MSGFPYEDIIWMDPPVFPNHPRMPVRDRAAQFAPFAALTGHGAAITETARLTERRIVAADDVLSENDSALNDLRQRISRRPVVTVSFFVPDEHKDGGSTVTETGSLKSIDEQTGSLVFENGLRISARDIVSLKEENQGNYAGNCP